MNNSYIAIAALIVAGLSKMGWIINQNDVVTIISGLVAIYGVISQHYTNKNLAQHVILLGGNPKSKVL